MQRRGERGTQFPSEKVKILLVDFSGQNVTGSLHSDFYLPSLSLGLGIRPSFLHSNDGHSSSSSSQPQTQCS